MYFRIVKNYLISYIGNFKVNKMKILFKAKKKYF